MLLMVLGPCLNSPLLAETVTARWEAHQVRFRFSSFNTTYNCELTRYKLEILLKASGVRDDVRVEVKCLGNEDLDAYLNFLLAFAVPVIANKSEGTAGTFPATWREVRLRQLKSRALSIEFATETFMVEQCKERFSRGGSRSPDDCEPKALPWPGNHSW